MKPCKKCGVPKPRSSRCKPCDAARAARYYEENKEAVLARQQDYHTKPEVAYKMKARQTVRNAVRDGRLVKGSYCQDCGTTGYLEGHHEDYDKPLWVEWLCIPCHRSRHCTL